jgi:hypothetical protein
VLREVLLFTTYYDNSPVRCPSPRCAYHLISFGYSDKRKFRQIHGKCVNIHKKVGRYEKVTYKMHHGRANWKEGIAGSDAEKFSNSSLKYREMAGLIGNSARALIGS